MPATSSSAPTGVLLEAEAAVLLRRGLRLEYATLAWNVVGSAVVLLAAVSARSAALAGFGLDSLIEIVASLVVVRQLRGDTRSEKRALSIVGVAFVLLALYVAGQSLYVLVSGFRPDRSTLGIVWLALTAAAMFALAFGKGRVGRALASRVLQTESRVTIVDGYLAVAVLAGLVLNAALGFWWADPAAGFVIVLYGAKEGGAALRA